jgi:hypothetical protein
LLRSLGVSSFPWVIFPLIGPRRVRMVDIEGILEEVVIKVIGLASRKNAFWLISMDRDCIVK